jgi:prostaglandin-H2 D-isomerase / glutathione transferase
MSTLRLTYFDAPGRAEPVRIALTLGGIAFEDRRLNYPAFAAVKAGGELPLGSLPILEVDGVTYTQTGAMLRYAAHLGNTVLYPSDPLQALVVDSVIDTLNDTVASALTPSLFERDMEKKLAMRKAIVEGVLGRALRYLEGLCARSEGPFLLGASLSLGDLLIGLSVQQYRSGVLDGIGPEVLEPFPRLRALGDAFLAHPDIVAYHARAHAH